MKRITILALGSWGDVVPFAVLGTTLQGRGYRVRLATFENFAELVRGYKLDFHPVAGDAKMLLNSTGGINLIESGQNVVKFYRTLKQTFGQLTNAYIESFSADALRDSDLILNQLPGGIFGRDLAELLQIPHVMGAVIPLVPTSAFPVPLLFRRSLGRRLNRFSYTTAEFLLNRMMGSSVRRFRQQVGLPAKSPHSPTNEPVINGFSQHVVPRPADWGDHIAVTGYWIMEQPDWQPPQQLVQFLENGQPPVFVGFGSMPVRDPDATLQTVLEALKQSGQRGVISRGWANLTAADLPADVLAIDYVPYTWLFPQMAAVVHHGGSGTTGVGLRAGTPTVIVPFVADQPYWGQRMVDLGVGPQPVPYKRLRADGLSAAISQAVQSRHMRRNASVLGQKLAQEDGVRLAADLIKRYLANA